MARLSGCLGTIGTFERRVLVLRAGIGPAAPLSRREVAARLDTRLRPVVRAERRGLRALRHASQAGRCQSQPAAVPAGTFDPSPLAGGGMALAADTESGDNDASRDDRDQASDRNGQRATGDESSSRAGIGNPPAALIPTPIGDAGPPLLLLLAVAFLTGFTVVYTKQRRRLR